MRRLRILGILTVLTAGMFCSGRLLALIQAWRFSHLILKSDSVVFVAEFSAAPTPRYIKSVPLQCLGLQSLIVSD